MQQCLASITRLATLHSRAAAAHAVLQLQVRRTSHAVSRCWCLARHAALVARCACIAAWLHGHSAGHIPRMSGLVQVSRMCAAESTGCKIVEQLWQVAGGLPLESRVPRIGNWSATMCMWGCKSTQVWLLRSRTAAGGCFLVARFPRARSPTLRSHVAWPCGCSVCGLLQQRAQHTASAFTLTPLPIGAH
jgi:hypothetical protein